MKARYWWIFSSILVIILLALAAKYGETWTAMLSGGEKESYRTILPIARDEKIFKMDFTVQRNEGYPVEWSGVTPIAEGLVSADGKRVEMRVTQSGLDSLTCEMKKVAGSNKEYSLQISGKWSGSSQKILAAKLNHSANNVGILFLDNQTLSVGTCRRQGGGSGQSGSSGDFDTNYKWEGSLKPGQKVRFGVRESLPNDVLTFTLDESMFSE